MYVSGESEYTMGKYAEVVRDILGLPPPPSQ